ncbi:MAG: ankyrin repeat domain-containing protein [Mariniblastus sp.]|nr:ankyrin repeat domain-containing protein [Mariniblastus sp.]
MRLRVTLFAFCLLGAFVLFPQMGVTQSSTLQNLISGNKVDALRQAIDEKPSLLNGPFANQQFPLHFAIQSVKPDVVDLLLQLGASTDVKDSQKRTPLHVALQRGNERMTYSVLAKTKDVNAVDRANSSCLIYAVMYQPSLAVIEALIQKGADLNLKNSSKQTPLHTACYFNRPAAANKLVDAGADLSARDNNANTPLLVACMTSPSLTRAMLAKGADPEAINRQKQTALHLASQSSYFNRGSNSKDNDQQWGSDFGFETFQILLREFDEVDVQDGQGRTPLNQAVSTGNPNVIKALIQRGADPNHELAGRGGGQRSPMVCQAAEVGSCEALVALIEGGANVNVTNQLGDNPLHLAAQGGGNIFEAKTNSANSENPFLRAIRVLLSAKTDANLKNAAGQTPIHVAAQRDFFAAVEVLVEKTKSLDFDLGTGSLLHWSAQNGMPKTAARILSLPATDVNQIDSQGHSPLQVAAEFGNPQLVEMLIASDARVDQVDQDGATALLIAATSGHAAIVRLLLGQGADWGKLDESGQTALHLAAWNGHAKVVDELLKKSDDASPKTKTGYTPLHASGWQGHAEVVERLLVAGAEPNVADSDGWTPLHKAAYRGHADAVKALLRHGANKSLSNGVEMTALQMAENNGQAAVAELLK